MPAAGAEYLSVLGEPAARAAAPARYRAAGALTAVEVGPVVTDQDPEAVTRWLLSHLGRQR